MRLEDLVAGVTVLGVVPASEVTVVAVASAGADAVVLTYRDVARRGGKVG